MTAQHTRVDVPASQAQGRDRAHPEDEGYIQGFKMVDEADGEAGRRRQVDSDFLKYGPHGERVITGLSASAGPAAASTSAAKMCPVLGGLGTSILTTSRGVMTGATRRQAGVGGEVLCATIW